MDNHFLAIFKTEFSTRKQQGKTFHWILFFYLRLISGCLDPESLGQHRRPINKQFITLNLP